MSDTAQSFKLDAMLAAARRRSGLDDFGPEEDFIEPLQLLLRSIDEESGAHEAGRAVLAERIVGLLADRLYAEDWFRRHPEILDERIESPVFIAALPRTGTTMLHRLLASDPEVLAVLWYECRYPVPLPGSEGAAIDPRIPRAEEEVRFMLANYPGLDAIHPMDAVGPDEEIMLLEHAFLSGMPQSMCNVPSYARWELDADHEPGYRYLEKMLKFLQWQKRRAGHSGHRWVLKSPEHLGRIAEIMRVFPDATLVQSHRDPMQTIPSFASMIYSGWAAHMPNPDRSEIVQVGGIRCRDFLRRAMRMREQLPAARFIDINYRDTVADPDGGHPQDLPPFGIGAQRGGAAEMAAWREANRRELRAKHEYSLEEFGLDAAWIEREFAEYRALHGFDRPAIGRLKGRR